MNLNDTWGRADIYSSKKSTASKKACEHIYRNTLPEGHSWQTPNSRAKLGSQYPQSRPVRLPECDESNVLIYCVMREMCMSVPSVFMCVCSVCSSASRHTTVTEANITPSTSFRWALVHTHHLSFRCILRAPVYASTRVSDTPAALGLQEGKPAWLRQHYVSALYVGREKGERTRKRKSRIVKVSMYAEREWER